LLFVNGLTQHPLDEDQTKFHLDFKWPWPWRCIILLSFLFW
jgi:hypothetical protein